MSNVILAIASAAVILSDRDTWGAFDWNRTECGLRVACSTLADDIRDAAVHMGDAFDEYCDIYR